MSVACGVDGGVVSERLEYDEYVVEASVNNASSDYVQITFYNNGPHGGSCDDKHLKSFLIAPKSSQKVKESWWCKMDQNFSIGANLLKGEEVTIVGTTAVIDCVESGCNLAQHSLK